MYLRLLRASVLLNAWSQLGVFLLLGALWAASAHADLTVILPVMLLAMVVVITSMAIGLPLFFRENRRVLAQLADASAAYAASRAEGEFAPARVVRSRSAARFPGFVAGVPAAVEPTARIVVLNALTAAGPRRMLALAPASWHGFLGNRAFAAVRIASPDAAVVDGRIDGATLQRIAADPRWNGKMPGERIGMQLAWIAGAALVGLAVGFGLTSLLSAAFG